MERWCPRCEWMGRSSEQPCPRCGASLIDLAELEPRRLPASPPPGPPPPRRSPPAPTEPDVEPAGEIVAGGRGGGWWPVVPIVVLLVVGVSAVLRTRARPVARPTIHPGATLRATPSPVLPARLAYITGGLDGGPGPVLYLAAGDGSLAAAPGGGDRATSFAWSPDGSHLAVRDVGGTIHLVPEGGAFGPAVRTARFANGGGLLAVCVGDTPNLVVLRADRALTQVWPGFPGCAPVWSRDDNYLAYRIPGAGGRFADQGFGVFNAHLDLRFPVTARWPATWAPSPGYAITPLTAVSPDGRAVQVMDPRGGQRRTLVPAALIDHAAAGPANPRLRPSFASHGPITLLSWSPDGQWLAIGLGATGRSNGTAFLVDPLSGRTILAGVPLAPYRLQPVSFSWSPSDALLIEATAPPRYSLTLEVRPLGTGVTIRIPAVQAGWSPDGRWILGRTPAGWTIVDAEQPSVAEPVVGSQTWTSAQWCCPPPVVTGAG